MTIVANRTIQTDFCEDTVVLTTEISSGSRAMFSIVSLSSLVLVSLLARSMLSKFGWGEKERWGEKSVICKTMTTVLLPAV